MSLGCRLASPPGGRVEQPVVNCRNAFLSSDDMPHKTLTNLRKPGLKEQRYSYSDFSTDCKENSTVLRLLLVRSTATSKATWAGGRASLSHTAELGKKRADTAT